MPGQKIYRSEKNKRVDEFVGNRIREARLLRGISQERLGKALGLTFQQVQKYERGTNRVGASRLFDIAEILGVPVSYFFEGLEQRSEEELSITDHELAFLRHFRMIGGNAQEKIYELVKTLAGVTGGVP